MKVLNLVQSVPLNSEVAYFDGGDRGQRLSDRISITHLMIIWLVVNIFRLSTEYELYIEVFS
jgi:hypothetical protein